MYWGIKDEKTQPSSSKMIARYAFLKVDCYCLNHDFIRLNDSSDFILFI